MKSAGKLVILFLSFLGLLSACQTNETIDPDPTPVSAHKWTWVSGANTVNQAGVYGTQGTAASSNVPGAREHALSWIDPSGKLWLFGGYAYDSVGYMGQFNDLWKFDPATVEWTWVSGGNTRNQAGIYGTKGVAAPSNVPGARNGAVSWLDPSGSLWLFGGNGYYDVGDFGSLNDLWKFDPTTLEWTWVSGNDTGDQAGTYGTLGTADPSNVPGARTGAVSWIDAQGNLWLFGGYGYDSAGQQGWLNDLWKYDPTTLEWTWISGSDTGDKAGTHGTKGTADPLNIPGGRHAGLSWLGPSGVLWLFGGDGLDSAGIRGDLNDIWKFDPTTLLWTWVSGSKTGNQSSNYGAMGAPVAANVPGGRFASTPLVDASGKLWLFGGLGRDSAGSRGWLNDLWKFDPATALWDWEFGSETGGQRGVYGTLGTVDASNIPGARYFAISWIDAQGKFWVFGGYGSDSAGRGGWLNDLWRSTR